MKGIYSFISVAVMAFGPVCVSAQVPLPGEGSEVSPYVISSSDDWNALAKYVTDNKDTFEGKFVKLSGDIDFTGVDLQPLWANNVTYLQGHFDGNGHVVKGLSMKPAGTYMGLFGTIGANGTVANVTVAGVCDATSVTTGGLAGRLYGTISNCVNEMNVSSNKPAVGGFVGRAFKGARLVDCVNKGTVSGTTNIGGIVGTTEAGVLFERCGNEGSIVLTGNNAGGIVASPCPSTFIDCWNKADITVQGATVYVAGIIGNAMGTVGSTVYTISGCRNYGNITGSRYVAGIVATVAAANAELNMTDCHNEGDITSTATSANYGASGIACAYSPLSRFVGCSNSGKITADKAGYNAGIAGGAIGAYSAQKTVEFTDCYNTGDVVSAATCTAGVIGHVNGYAIISGCYNTGTVTCSSLSGGVVGNLDGLNNTLNGCWNTGDVTTNLNRVGGLFGSNTKNNVKIQNCWNAGDVKSTSTATGMADATGAYAIGGLGGIAAAKFYDCFNLGNVTGMAQVGGIVGRPALNMTGLFNCYSVAQVDGPSDQAGNLVGVNTADKQQWSVANKADNCFYVTDCGDACTLDQSIGVSTTIAALCKAAMGDGWTSAGDYMLPLPSVFASSDAALLHAAMVVPAVNEKLSAISSSFHVGNPAGIKWVSDCPAIEIAGDEGRLVAAYTGQAVLTAALGDYMKTVNINVNGTTGINDVAAPSDAEVVSESWFDAAGRGVSAAVAQSGQVYIVVRTYSDGSTSICKLCK